MNMLKWFFMSKYKKFLYAAEVQYRNRGGLWVYTDNYSIRFDFGNMKIEVHEKENGDDNN